MGSAQQSVGRPRSAEHATVLVIGTALATLSSAIIPLAVVRLLGKADVASLLALLLVYDTVALLFTSGFPQTLMYQLASRDAPERRAIAYRSVGVLTTLGCLAGVVLAGIGLGADALLVSLTGESATSLRPLLVFALLPVVDLPSRLLPNLLVAEGHSRPVAIIGVVRALSNSLAVLVPVALGLGVWAVATCYVAVGLLRAAALLVIVLRLLYRDVPAAPSPLSRRRLLSFALPLGATDIVAMLNQQLDRYLILFSFPAAGFAIYQAGAWQVPVVNDVPYQVGTAYAPRFADLFKNGKAREAVELWGTTIKKVSLIVLPVMTVFVVAAEEVMELLFTRAYLDAAPVFRLYSVLTLGRVAAFGTMIVAAGRPQLVLQAALLSFGSNLLISVPLVLTIGFLGPALGTVIAFLPTVVFYCWCISRASAVPLRDVFPLGKFARVGLVVAAAATPAVLFKWQSALGPGATLAGVSLLLLMSYAALGTLSGQIEHDDWRFVLNRFRAKRPHETGSRAS